MLNEAFSPPCFEAETPAPTQNASAAPGFLNTGRHSKRPSEHLKTVFLRTSDTRLPAALVRCVIEGKYLIPSARLLSFSHQPSPSFARNFQPSKKLNLFFASTADQHTVVHSARVKVLTYFDRLHCRSVLLAFIDQTFPLSPWLRCLRRHSWMFSVGLRSPTW